MDGNKDDALKCLGIGKDALNAGDRARAFRFISKAQRLDPTLPVDDLLSSINGTCESKAPYPPRSPDKQDKPAGGPSAPSSSKAEAAEPTPPPSGGSPSKVYTEEQLLLVRRIKKQKDYYQILGLERSCSVEDVRKAYRKLSLKVHPDKNKAPGAEEAFKAVSKAFQCLSTEDSRSRYDTEGTDEPATHIRRARRQDMYNGFNGFYEADIDAEEIFRNFFFSGGMHQAATTPFGTFRFRTGGMGGQAAQGGHASSNSGLRMCLQVIPVILLLLLNFLPSSEPPYALSQSYSFEQRLETPRGVPFFVKPGKFEQQYPRNTAERLALEDRVEKEYLAIVSQNCRLEMQRKQWGFVNQTPHCDLLQKYNDAVAAA